MGIFDDIFGNKKKGSTSSSSNTTSDVLKGEISDQATASQTKTQQEGSQEGRTTGTNVTTQFTPDQMDTINTLINRAASRENIFGDPTQSALDMQGKIAQTLTDRVSGGGVNIDNIVSAAQDSARLNYEEGQAADLSVFSDAIGSKGNTLVQLLRDKGNRGLATSLGAIEGDIRLKGEELQNQTAVAGTQAAEGFTKNVMTGELGKSQALNDALAALGVAKGGVTSSIGDELTSLITSQEGLSENLTTELNRILTQIHGTEKTKATGTTASSGGLLDNLGTILGALNTGSQSAPA